MVDKAKDVKRDGGGWTISEEQKDDSGHRESGDEFRVEVLVREDGDKDR